MTQAPLHNSDYDEVSESIDSATQANSALPGDIAPQSLLSTDQIPEESVVANDASRENAAFSQAAPALTAAATDAADSSAPVDPSESTMAPVVDLHIGQLVGTVRIEERLGSGAMASIYRGRNMETGHQLAIKVLSSAADDVLQARFRLEARTVRNLDHPHIVKIVDSGQSRGGLTYIAMDLVEGEDLGTLLERQHQLSVPDTCRILRPIADALAYAHAAGVVHRDVKPSNILLRRVAPGTPTSVQLTDIDYAVIPLLSDFGIARALDAPELTTAGRTIGTPAYMSPEQCAGNRALDGRADIYSLGTVLYRCLVGRPPFVGATTQILHAHVYEALTIPDTIADRLPSTVLAILQKSLQKEPADRYADPSELAVALSHVETLYAKPGTAQQALQPVDSTATMPSLPATPPAAAQSTVQVLVPGVREQARPQSNSRMPSLSSSAVRAIPHRRTEHAVEQTTRGNRTGRTARAPVTWVAVLLGILLTTGIALVGFLLLLTLTPNWLRFTPGPSAVGEAALVIDTPTPPLAGDSVGRSDGSIGAALLTDTVVANPDSLPLATPATVTATPTATISPTEQRVIVQSTDDLNVAATWDDVLHYYQMGNWGQTRWSLMSMLSAEDGVPDLALANSTPIEQAEQIYTLLANTGAMYWIKWGDTFQPQQVGKILADTYVGLATMEPDPLNLPPTAIEYLQAAATVLPEDLTMRRLSATTARFLNADIGEQDLWVGQMAAAYAAYITERFADSAYCSAADAAEAINARVPETIPSADVTAYRQRCAGLIASIAENVETVRNLRDMNGTIYYSTEIDGRYAIIRTDLDPTLDPIGNSGSGVILLQDAAQPSFNGTQLAFYSRRSDSQGLSGVDLAMPFNPDDRFSRYTGAVEDAQQSPARWNPMTGQLVFSSGVPGQSSQIFSAPAMFAGNNSTKLALGFGEDPAWSPDGNWIVFRNAGDSGLGLYVMSAGGQEQKALTNGDDRRPIWTSDGKYIVFMRQVSSGNWEIYRYEYGTGDTARLTNDDAQDGLPALSPDGQTVVFATDRTEQWQLWTVPLLGGDAELLMPIQGTLLQWLEHAIQWVN